MANKENVARSVTKIPIPKKTVSPLPPHLIADSNKDIHTDTKNRQPLITLNQPGPCKSEHKEKNLNQTEPSESETFSLLNFDSRNVTIRRKKKQPARDVSRVCEEINSTIIIISDDEEDHDVLNTGFLMTDSDEEEPVTPKLTTLELKSTSNIKSNLKRPHNNVPRSLSKTEYMTQILPYLLETEENLPVVPRVPGVSRTCIFNWLMKLNNKVGHPCIIQAAIKYFDTILVKNRLENIQIIGVTCYWIAHKLNKRGLTATKMVTFFGTKFTVTQLIDTEKEVLEMLGSSCLPVVEQDYITIFARCVEDISEEIELAASFLCMSGILFNKCLGMEYPSAVAAAALKKAVMLLEKGEETLKSLESSPVYKLAVKKTNNLEKLCYQLCEAVFESSFLREDSILLKLYGAHPHFAAQKVLTACKKEMNRLRSF